ncbi:MAG: hypothetical protein IJE40_01315 [Clostridia bacterium]|nr:hypothetical protein [Clostridia bacterium]
MEKQEKISGDYYAIDIFYLIKILWGKAWIIALCGFIAAAVGFSVAKFAIAPTYSSTILLYVNNSSFSLGNTSFSITSSDISASRSLVNTYSEILNNRTTLERIIDKTGLPYTYKDLSEMIVASPSNETEIMRVKVTSKDPYEASDIANTIAEVLPIRISEIIDGATMEVVDSAIPILEKVAPSITRYTAVGLLLGLFISAAVIVVMAMLDDTIHDEDYVIKTYDYPILAKVPDLMSNSTKKRYGYYYQSKDTSEG